MCLAPSGAGRGCRWQTLLHGVQDSTSLFAVDFLARVQTFVRIADAGSISKAARAVGLSVPMASRHLRSLELELGAELVRRSTRQLQLTEAGLDFLGRARRLLQEVEDARNAVRPGKGVQGTLIVSLPVSLGISQISQLVPGLLVKHPRLRLELRFDDRIVDLLAENVDIAIRAGVAPPDSGALVARRLATYERLLCASPAFVKSAKTLKDPQSLEQVSCLVQGFGPARWRLETAGGIVEVVVDGPLRTTNVLALRDAALAGLGVAQLPLGFVADDLRRKRLVRVLKGAAPPTGALYGVYHRGARGSAAIRAFLDHVAEGYVERSRLSL